jgi:hypothetical protein
MALRGTAVELARRAAVSVPMVADLRPWLEVQNTADVLLTNKLSMTICLVVRPVRY